MGHSVNQQGLEWADVYFGRTVTSENVRLGPGVKNPAADPEQLGFELPCNATYTRIFGNLGDICDNLKNSQTNHTAWKYHKKYEKDMSA